MSYQITEPDDMYHISSVDGSYHVEIADIDTYSEIVFSSVQGVTIEQLSITLKADVGGVISVDWGDGSTVAVSTSGHDHTITSGYVTGSAVYVVKISGSLEFVRKLAIENSTTIEGLSVDDIAAMGLNHLSLENVSGVSGSISSLPSSLRWLTLWNVGSILTGDIRHISGLVWISIEGLAEATIDLDYLGEDIAYMGFDGDDNNMTVVGSINNFADLVRSLELINCGSSMTGSINSLSGCNWLQKLNLYNTLNLTGSISNLDHGEIYFLQMYNAGAITGSISDTGDELESGVFRNCGEITGNIEDVVTSVKLLYLVNSGSSVIYGGGVLPGWEFADLYLQIGMTSAELDDFLINWALTAIDGIATINLKGSNEVRTSASDSAVAILTGLGKDIQTN